MAASTSKMNEDGRIPIELNTGREAGIADAILQQCLHIFPHIRLRVTGTCMMPDLQPGDTVAIVSQSRREPKWGDIVLVRHQDGLRLHRLVWRWPFSTNRFRWVTKADRAVVCDPRVSPANLLGTVVRVEGGSFARRMGNAWVRTTARSLIAGLTAWGRGRLLSRRFSA